MDNACRLCLQSQKHMIPIFRKNDEPLDLQSQIQDYCCIEISEGDVLPKSICDDCNTKLHSIYKFREQCKQSEQQLHEHYKITNIKSLETPKVKEFQNVGVQTDPCDHSSVKVQIITDETDHKVCDEKVLKLSTVKDNKNDKEDVIAETSIEYSEPHNSGDTDINSEHYHSENEENLQANIKKDIKTKTCPSRISERQKFACEVCKKTYTNKKTLLKHAESHAKVQIFTCEYCKKVFDTKGKLTRHTKKHGTDGTFKCEVCGMPFKEEYKLKRHLRVHGKGQPIKTEKQYLCDMCSRTFATKSGLHLHLKIHNGLKPFKCKFCTKTFPIFSYKKRHERTHTGNKDFVCHICSAPFASSNGLKYHLMVHTGETKFDCKTCGKSFRRRKYLKEHIYTHTGERPFACEICGSAYGSSGSLFVHFRKCKSLNNSNSTFTIQAKEEVKPAG